MKYDYSLYLVTDRNLMTTATLEEAVEQAILGGCSMVQLREKELDTKKFYKLAISIKAVTQRYGVPLIINDRTDIALAADAAGVHVGQRDLPIKVIRQMIGKKILGVSVTNEKEAVTAEDDGADYLGVGAIFPTNTKKDAKYVSLEELNRIRRSVSIPIVVIGGISRLTAPKLKNTNIDGLAVVSDIIAQKDIQGAARELKNIFRNLRI